MMDHANIHVFAVNLQTIVSQLTVIQPKQKFRDAKRTQKAKVVSTLGYQRTVL